MLILPLHLHTHLLRTWSGHLLIPRRTHRVGDLEIIGIVRVIVLQIVLESIEVSPTHPIPQLPLSEVIRLLLGPGNELLIHPILLYPPIVRVAAHPRQLASLTHNRPLPEILYHPHLPSREQTPIKFPPRVVPQLSHYQVPLLRRWG